MAGYSSMEGQYVWATWSIHEKLVEHPLNLVEFELFLIELELLLHQAYLRAMYG
jgi:hypothetical protein